MKKKTHTDYVVELKEKLPNIECLGIYNGRHNKITHKCLKCNYIWDITPGGLLSGKGGCPECGRLNRGRRLRMTHEEFMIKFNSTSPKSNKIEIISRYVKGTEKIQCKCLVDNHIWSALPSNLLRGYGCPECRLRNMFGAKNSNYNPDITDEERDSFRNFPGRREWLKEVYERDNYTCRKCGIKGSGNLNAHHLDGYHWCKEKRNDVENGITLCINCHKEYHKKYGRKNSKREQLEEFLK